MSDAFDWGSAETVTVKRDERRERPKDVPLVIIRMAQDAYDANEKVWKAFPDKPVAALFLTYIRAAGDHTRKASGACELHDTETAHVHPTTVLAKLATKDENGKDIPKSKAGKVVEFIVTERRGQKSKDETENSEVSDTGNGDGE